MCPSPRSRSDGPAGASTVAPLLPAGQLSLPAPAYAGSGWVACRPRSSLNRKKVAPPISRSSRRPMPPPKPPPIPPKSIEPRSPPRATPATPPMRPPKKLGRCWNGDGWVSSREGLEGVVGLAGDEGRAGVEYDREPRLPPLPARAHTLAVSASSNETSATPIRVRRIRDVIGHTLRPYSMLRERLRGDSHKARLRAQPRSLLSTSRSRRSRNRRSASLVASASARA